MNAGITNGFSKDDALVFLDAFQLIEDDMEVEHPKYHLVSFWRSKTPEEQLKFLRLLSEIAYPDREEPRDIRCMYDGINNRLIRVYGTGKPNSLANKC